MLSAMRLLPLVCRGFPPRLQPNTVATPFRPLSVCAERGLPPVLSESDVRCRCSHHVTSYTSLACRHQNFRKKFAYSGMVL